MKHISIPSQENKTKKKFAAFDIDGTIFRSSLFVELLDSMVCKNILSPQTKHLYQEKLKLWKSRRISYEDYIKSLIDYFHNNIKGVFYGDFADTAKEVVKNKNTYTYTYTTNLLETLKDKGYFLVAISHSPKTILDLFCPQMGFDKIYGMVFEIDDKDLFTGKIADKFMIFNKANIIHRVVEQNDLTMEGSVAVGDTETDIPMLEMVETPICFNPNKKLYQRAKSGQWKIVVERKDVIYHI